MHTEKTPSKIYFEHLDIIRFIAAFMIIIMHGYEAWKGWFGNNITIFDNEYGDRFIGNFGIGVDIFFLISGFLITYILLEEKKRFGKIHIWKFMMRRTIRIWPLYFLLIILAPFFVKITHSTSPSYLENIFFLGNFEVIKSGKWAYPFAHFWSIAIEEHFYLVWPFIIALIPNKHLLKTFVFLIILSISFRLYTFLTSGYAWFEIYLHTLSRIDVLIIGGIGAYHYSNKKFHFQLSTLIRRSLFVVLITILAVQSTVNWNSLFMAGFLKYTYISIIAALLLDYNLNPNYKHILPNKSFIHYLGKISYGIYMYGNILLLIVIRKIMLPLGFSSVWVFYLFVIGLSIIVPIISYEIFEKRILKLNKYFRVIKTDR